MEENKGSGWGMGRDWGGGLFNRTGFGEFINKDGDGHGYRDGRGDGETWGSGYGWGYGSGNGDEDCTGEG